MLMKQDEKTLSLYGASFSERLATAVFMLMGIPLGFALVLNLVSARKHFKEQSRPRIRASVLLQRAIGIEPGNFYGSTKTLRRRRGDDPLRHSNGLVSHH